MSAADKPILEVRDLAVAFATDEGVVQAVDGVSFDLRAGEILAVVGESGCGKSVTAMTLLGLTRSPNARFDGTATYKGTELLGATDEELQRVRGAEIAMIFQDPMASLNPVMKIGEQIAEQILAHNEITKVAGPRPRDRAARPRRHPAGARARRTPTRTSSPAACASA